MKIEIKVADGVADEIMNSLVQARGLKSGSSSGIGEEPYTTWVIEPEKEYRSVFLHWLINNIQHLKELP